MAHAERFPRRHPLCTCPEWTFAMYDGRQAPPDQAACRGGTVAHPPPLDAGQLRQLLDVMLGRRPGG